ncbi:MAG: hypothetical protein LR015_11430 [Verrucomicrobia bacterium]|nr:hypothetical protein [Verrucomicrobiota bacterium]
MANENWRIHCLLALEGFQHTFVHMSKRSEKPRKPSISKAQRLLQSLIRQESLAPLFFESVDQSLNSLTFNFCNVQQTISLSEPTRFDRQKLWYFRVETEILCPIAKNQPSNWIDLVNFSSNLGIGCLVPSRFKKHRWAVCSVIPFVLDLEELVAFTLEKVILGHWLAALDFTNWPREILEFFDPLASAPCETSPSINPFIAHASKRLCHPKSPADDLLPDRASVRQQVCQPPFVFGQWHDSQVWGMVPWGNNDFAHFRYDNEAYHPCC